LSDKKLKLLDAKAWKINRQNKHPDTNVGLVKSCVEEVELVSKEAGFGDRVIAWTVSTEDRDRDNDRIKVPGWTLKNFRNNPVVMWAHNYSEPPIGRGLKVWKDRDGDKPRLRMLKQFTTKEENPFGDMIFNLAKSKFIRTASVGFQPLDFEIDPEQDEETKNSWFPGLLFKKQDLLESSVVPVPSNPFALEEAKSVHVLWFFVVA